MTARIVTTEPDADRPPAPRFAFDRHTWKEIAYLLSNLPIAVLGFVYVVTMLATGVGLAVTVIGLPVLAAGLLGARQLGKAERGGPARCSGCASRSRARCRADATRASSAGCGPA